MRSRARSAMLVCGFALLALPTAAAAAPQPFGTNDAGGFRNVLPPGADGVNNALELAGFTATGALPPHLADQQSLYDDLILAEPSLTSADIDRLFKDATFGVPAGQVESTVNPRPGVVIQRDSAYGVPHVYGDTRADTTFGAGYANASDRLFLMDVLRHTGRAELSSFIGGSPSNRAMDRAQWQFAPYTDADLQAQFDAADDFYGADGAQLQADAQSYVDGINAYIQDALLNPSLLPAEYAALLKSPQPWSVRDVVATASLIGGIFGKGGGRELDSALALRSLQARFGKKAGKRSWADFRAKNDPEAPTTLTKRFPYMTESPFSKRGLAIPDPASVRLAPVAPPVSARKVNAGDAEYRGIAGFGASILRAMNTRNHASNWLLLPRKNSRTGHPIGVLGPQVGYYQPQILMEMDIHGPGIDARGATFPGVGLYVLLGHGRDYAWSATTATSDNVDTFAEVLCGGDDFHYLYKGECLPMERLDRNNAWTPSAIDDTPPGSETLTAYRTVHGIVSARGTVGGRKVAFVISRSTYFHEADSALFFKDMNDPEFMAGGARSFAKAAAKMNFAFNWSYLDSKNVAYRLTGWYPQRAPGTSPDFPVLGTGQFDWKGYDPARHFADWLPERKHPHAVDPEFLVSWNNKQAPGWAAADDQYAYGAIHRSQMISDKVAAGTKGKRKMSLVALVKAMEGPATQDLRAYRLLPILLKVIGKPKDGALRAAVADLRAWRKAGSHRRDLDRDGAYENNSAVQLMDAWWPLLVGAQFKPALGADAYGKELSMLPTGDHTRGEPTAPDYFAGWWGYSSKDLRTVLGKRVPGWSRAYCGSGRKARSGPALRKSCRKALLGSLRQALQVTPAELYGFGDCAPAPTPRCFDLNRAIVASGIEIPPGAFQNRPTFQQTVSVTQDVP